MTKKIIRLNAKVWMAQQNQLINKEVKKLKQLDSEINHIEKYMTSFKKDK